MKKSILFSVVALVVITLSMSSSSKTEAHDETCEDMFTLSNELIQAMKFKYENTQYNYINEKLELTDGLGDAKAIWFSLDVLEEFICQIKTHRPEGLSDEDLGIRLYYTAYPELTEWHKYPKLKRGDDGEYPIPETYAERHTLILLPTGKVGLHHQDLYVTEPNSTGVRRLALTGTDIDDDRKPGKNSGSLFPPGDIVIGHR